MSKVNDSTEVTPWCLGLGDQQQEQPNHDSKPSAEAENTEPSCSLPTHTKVLSNCKGQPNQLRPQTSQSLSKVVEEQLDRQQSLPVLHESVYQNQQPTIHISEECDANDPRQLTQPQNIRTIEIGCTLHMKMKEQTCKELFESVVDKNTKSTIITTRRGLSECIGQVNELLQQICPLVLEESTRSKPFGRMSTPLKILTETSGYILQDKTPHKNLSQSPLVPVEANNTSLSSAGASNDRTKATQTHTYLLDSQNSIPTFDKDHDSPAIAKGYIGSMNPAEEVEDSTPIVKSGSILQDNQPPQKKFKSPLVPEEAHNTSVSPVDRSICIDQVMITDEQLSESSLTDSSLTDQINPAEELDESSSSSLSSSSWLTITTSSAQSLHAFYDRFAGASETKIFIAKIIKNDKRACQIIKGVPVLDASQVTVEICDGEPVVLGMGGYGRVVKGTLNGNHVAVKILHEANMFDMLHEASLMYYAAKHAKRVAKCYGIVGVLGDHDEEPKVERLACVMQQIGTLQSSSPMTLCDFIYGKYAKKATPRCYIRIMLQLATTLSNLHINKLIVADLYTKNILMKKDKKRRWTAYLIDFGLSSFEPHPMERDEEFDTYMTFEEYKEEHPHLAPELYYRSPDSIVADVFALGVIVKDMLEVMRDNRRRQKSTIPLSWLKLRDLADQCCHRCPRRRPTAGSIVATLQWIYHQQNV